MHEIGTNETSPTGHDDVLRSKQFSHTYILPHGTHIVILHTKHHSGIFHAAIRTQN